MQDPSVAENRFFDNEAFYEGGGVRFCYFGGSLPRPRVERNVFRGNQSYNGAGLHCQDVDSLTISECVIDNNQALGNGGGLMVGATATPGVIELNRCTLSANTASTTGGGGIYADTGLVTLSSSIVSANLGCGLVVGQGAPPPSLLSDYCDVWNNLPDDYLNCTPGPNSVSLDPMFCGTPPPLALWLHVDSPCVGTGAGGVNMGAYGVGCGGTSVEMEPAPAGVFHLSVNPNPVVGSARLTFNAIAGPLSLEIYDSNGRLLERLRTASPQHWTPGPRAPRGVYFARLRGDGVSEVVKLVVVH